MLGKLIRRALYSTANSSALELLNAGNSPELVIRLLEAEKNVQYQRAETEAQRAETEVQRALKEAQRADTEAQRALKEAERAAKEAQRADFAEINYAAKELDLLYLEGTLLSRKIIGKYR